VHWQHPHEVTHAKRERKETNKKNPQQAIESQRKAKSKITWRRQVSDPLGKGNGSTHPRQNLAQTKSANHRTRARTPQRAPPKPKHTPPEQMQQCTTGMQQRAKNCSLCPGRLDRLHRAVRPPAPDLTAWRRLDRPNWNTFQTLPGAESMHKLLPLVDIAWIKAKCENLQHIASQIYKIHHKRLHKSKLAS
jgi:hypothetical protein